jgi:hypothetical protein
VSTCRMTISNLMARALSLAVLVALGLTSLAVPATAQADPPGSFQTPSGGIYCSMGEVKIGIGRLICEGGHGFMVGKNGCEHLAWGDRFSISQGEPVESHCHGDTIKPSYSGKGPNPAVPILGYGQTRSAGTITCDSETTGLTCTDSSTGHYFFMSREANELG